MLLIKHTKLACLYMSRNPSLGDNSFPDVENITEIEENIVVGS